MKKAHFKRNDLDFIEENFPNTFYEIKKLLNSDGLTVDYHSDKEREKVVTILEEAQFSDKALDGIEPNKIGLRVESIIDSINLVDY
ncbi:hypothetical protein [Companilactobacillus baiquanensis]|uniref:Uncharacterized protein n=1 Tax=Companilactobacillus baiquanensis TaxID=2486005 RepID=A0ABW1UVS0_9LACO|nr:hypothetical protein [Companilactobacillus baiquanensis]